MNDKLRNYLYQRKQLLEAQLNAYHFLFPVLEATRLLIRINSLASNAVNFWNSNRDILNNETRTHMALMAEYNTVMKQLYKLNHVNAEDHIIMKKLPGTD